MDYEKTYKALRKSIIDEYLKSEIPEITRDLGAHYFQKGKKDILLKLYKNICELEENNSK